MLFSLFGNRLTAYCFRKSTYSNKWQYNTYSVYVKQNRPSNRCFVVDTSFLKKLNLN